MSVKKEKNKIPPDKLSLYDELIKTIPDIERKGIKLPYTSFNGHMFTFLSESGYWPSGFLKTKEMPL